MNLTEYRSKCCNSRVVEFSIIGVEPEIVCSRCGVREAWPEAVIKPTSRAQSAIRERINRSKDALEWGGLDLPGESKE